MSRYFVCPHCGQVVEGWNASQDIECCEANLGHSWQEVPGPDEEEVKMTGYNGYKNYETWATYLWLTNDEATYFYWRERAYELLRNPRQAAYDLAHELREAVCEDTPLIGEANLYSDLLGTAVQEIDFYELAERFLEP